MSKTGKGSPSSTQQIKLPFSRNSDITQPPTIPANRTRSTSTINSESSQKMIPPSNTERQISVNSQTVKRSPDQRIIVVWLERVEDMNHFSYGELIKEKK
jgi:hypothetical protein